MLLFVLIGRDPVKEDHDVLRLGVLDGSLAKGGVAAHVKKTLILLVVLHRFKNISNLIQSTNTSRKPQTPLKRGRIQLTLYF